MVVGMKNRHPRVNAGSPDKIGMMIKKRLRSGVFYKRVGRDYFPPKSLLKKLAIPSKNPGWRVATPAGVPA